jgi:hypothetical protein
MPQANALKSIGYTDTVMFLTVADKVNGGQPACPEEWKKCKEEHE